MLKILVNIIYILIISFITKSAINVVKLLKVENYENN